MGFADVLAFNLGGVLAIAVQAVLYAALLAYARAPHPLGRVLASVVPVMLMAGPFTERLLRGALAAVAVMLLASGYSLACRRITSPRGRRWAVVILLPTAAVACSWIAALHVVAFYGGAPLRLLTPLAAAVALPILVLPPAPALSAPARIVAVLLALGLPVGISSISLSSAPRRSAAVRAIPQAPSLLRSHWPLAELMNTAYRVTVLAKGYSLTCPTRVSLLDSLHQAVSGHLIYYDLVLARLGSPATPAQAYFHELMRGYPAKIREQLEEVQTVHSSARFAGVTAETWDDPDLEPSIRAEWDRARESFLELDGLQLQLAAAESQAYQSTLLREALFSETSDAADPLQRMLRRLDSERLAAWDSIVGDDIAKRNGQRRE